MNRGSGGDIIIDSTIGVPHSARDHRWGSTTEQMKDEHGCGMQIPYNLKTSHAVRTAGDGIPSPHRLRELAWASEGGLDDGTEARATRGIVALEKVPMPNASREPPAVDATNRADVRC
jgi:hypothetical protein